MGFCFQQEIKLASLRSKAPTDIDDRMEMAEAVINQAKTKLITQVVKQNMIENIVPIVIALKHNVRKTLAIFTIKGEVSSFLQF